MCKSGLLAIRDKPVQHRSCTVSGIARKPFRLETEALLCSIDHGSGRADLSLTNGEQYRADLSLTNGEQYRSSAPDDLRALRHRAVTGRKAALVRSSTVPSWLAPTKIRVSKMESGSPQALMDFCNKIDPKPT